MAKKTGQKQVPCYYLTGLQWVPIENPFHYCSIAVGGFLEDGTSLVQRALYLLLYFHFNLWLPILWRPLCGEPSGAHFTMSKLIVAATHNV